MAENRIRAHGLSVVVPPAFEGRIARAPGAEPVLHVASVVLPEVRGDFGGAVVETLTEPDVFVALIEYEPSAASTALFATEGLPRINAARFRPETLHRTIAGQTGAQWFLHVGPRAFCLYVVLGSHADRFRLAPQAAAVVDSITFS